MCSSPAKVADYSRRARPSLLDVIFAVVLFLTVTDLYRFGAVWARFNSLAPLTGAFALAAFVYTLHYCRYSCLPLSRWMAWTTFLLVIPIASLVYSPNPNFRDVALQVFYLSLLWGSKVFFSRPGTRSIHGILVDGALAVGCAGVILSIFKPELFAALAQVNDRDMPYYHGRGYGFYLQPNVCAASLTLLFFLWLFVRRPRRTSYVMVSLTYLLTTILTGSRAGVVMAVFLVAFYPLLAGPGWNLARLGARMVRVSLLGGVGLAIVVAAVFSAAPRLASGGVLETLKRVGGLLAYRELLQQDASVRGRVDHVKDYMVKCYEQPFIGYGIASAPVMRAQGLLEAPSHNTFIEFAFTYGSVGILAWVVVVMMTWEDCRLLRSRFQYKIHVLFFGTLALACLASNTVLGNRILYVVLGWLLATRYTSQAAWKANNAALPTEAANEKATVE